MNTSRLVARSLRVPAASAALLRLGRRLRHWWVVRSFAFRRVEVRMHATGEAIFLEGFVGGLRLARLVALQATALPEEPWTDSLPRDHPLPIVWISECLVSTAFRHRGVGRRMITRLTEEAFVRHQDALVVGWAPSPQARQFSAAVGFHVRGEAAYASLGGIAGRLLA